MADATNDPIILKVRRDRMRRAERAVEQAKARLRRAEEATQRAWDKRTEAEDALTAAEHDLSLIRRDQEVWENNK
jgi:capsule polysaccharide export protein KpsE/RkpR